MEGLQQSAPCASDVLNGQVWGSWCVLKTVLALVGGMWWDLCHGPSGSLVAPDGWIFFGISFDMQFVPLLVVAY